MGGKTIRNEAAKIAGFQVNASTYGLPVAEVFGTARVSGNVIDYFNFTAHPHTSTQRAGKGGTKVQNTTYTYSAAVAVGLCEGPVTGIGRVWKQKEVLGSPAAAGFTVFTGNRGQLPWGYAQSKDPSRALPYSGLCYVAGVLDLGDSASLPEFNFEVNGKLIADGLDANPADVIRQILNDVGVPDSCIDLDILANYRRFCRCSDMLISLGLTDTEKAINLISSICLATNTTYFWSQDKLKFIPRAGESITRNGDVYSPNLTPVYDLTDDDFLEQPDGALVSFERSDRSETYNHVIVEFLNRANEYNKEQAEFKAQTDINRRGLKSMPVKNLYCLATKERARYAAATIARYSLYSRVKYRFSLDWSKCLLEPGDIVTLTTRAGLTLDKKAVEITEIEEKEDGILDVVAVEKDIGACGPPTYPSQEAVRPEVNIGQVPSDTRAPLFYRYPGTERTVGIAACGTDPARWGGCEVWCSLDGSAYQYLGEVAAPSRYGVILTDMTADSTEVTVQLHDTSLQILPVSAEAAEADGSLILIGNEWLGFEGAQLTGPGIYRLSGLRRGRIGTTAAAHSSGSGFVRFGQAGGYRHSYQERDIGRALYIKLPAKNIFGTNTQGLEDVPAYRYTIT